MIRNIGGFVIEGFYERGAALCGVEEIDNGFVVTYLRGRKESFSKTELEGFFYIDDIGKYSVNARPKTKEFIREFKEKLRKKRPGADLRKNPKKTRGDYKRTDRIEDG